MTEVRDETWEIGGVTVTAAPVQHPGGALGYRLEDADGTLAFIPDNELGLDPDAGLELATGVDVLLHDAQYTADGVPGQGGVGPLVAARLRVVRAPHRAGAGVHVPP